MLVANFDLLRLSLALLKLIEPIFGLFVAVIILFKYFFTFSRNAMN